jgi:HD-GYP domain-containing protein (c-di-GMP phosphodiesterase class II)
VAQVLKIGFRADDIVCRLGGDEFVIILSKTTIIEAEIIMKRITKLLDKETVYGITLSLSFGVFAKSNSKEDITEIFKKTEDIMYKNKLVKSDSMRSQTLQLVMNTLFEKNERESKHSNRVGEYCFKLAKELNLSKEIIEQMKLAGYMHDIGKIGISEEILNKTGNLSPLEFEEVKRHSEIGYRILSSVNEFSDLANFVLQHHERHDGTGYPKGLKGNEILLESKIITISDSFDAMTSPRSYGVQLSIDDAIEELKRCSGSQFDPEIVRVFIEKVLHRNV